MFFFVKKRAGVRGHNGLAAERHRQPGERAGGAEGQGQADVQEGPHTGAHQVPQHFRQ